jgi:hypothetical protein
LADFIFCLRKFDFLLQDHLLAFFQA